MTEEDDTPTDAPQGSFKENYATLREISERLRRQADSGDEVPDIDQLVPDVEKAAAAYKACQARIDAAARALQETLPVDETEASGEDAAPDSTDEALGDEATGGSGSDNGGRPGSGDPSEDDIPF